VVDTVLRDGMVNAALRDDDAALKQMRRC